MTDLINKVNNLIQNDLQSLQNTVNNYTQILELLKNKDEVPYIAFIIDIAVKHIKNHHQTETPDLKAWSVVVIKDLFRAGVLKHEDDVPNIIDEFIKHFKSEYPKYKENHVAVSEYDMELGFAFSFIQNKKQQS